MPISASIEVERPPPDVFAYVTDPGRFVEWQKGIVSGHVEHRGAPSVGDRCVATRRIGFGERDATSELTDVDPPRTGGCVGSTGRSERR